jgi:lysophospholipase L1-like esterase
MAMMTRSMVQIRLIILTCLCALALAACTTTARCQQFALKDGDTVVFYGDSITAQRLYTKYVEEFLLTRYPKLHLRFVNAGVPGDTVQGGYAGAMAERVQRDVAPLQPAMITVMLGMNDGGWGQGSPQIDATFQMGYHSLLDALHKAAPGAALTLIAPTPYDEITHGTEFPGYSRVIDEFADDVSRMCAELQASGDKTVLLADFHRPLTGLLERAKTQFPQLAPLIIPDRIHPSETGHWIMAASLMSAWHINPIVSRLALNAGSAEVISKDRTTVTNLERLGDGLKWTQIDDALPLPLDFNNAMTSMLLKISDIAQLNQMILRIESLKPGQYELSIDGNAVATFSREELQRGVNLALFKTPMLDQAREIDSQEDQRVTLDQARFILSVREEKSPTSAIAESTLQQVQDELVAKVRKDLDPMPHHFELRRQ